MVIIMSPSVPLTTKIMARVWYCQTVEPEVIWGSYSSRDAGIALYPLQPSLAQRLPAPPHHSRTGNPTVAPPKRLWAPPVLPALNSALKNHRSTYKKKNFNHSSQSKRSKQIHTKKGKKNTASQSRYNLSLVYPLSQITHIKKQLLKRKFWIHQ